MPAKADSESCTGCGDCVDVCPVDGVIVVENEKAVVNEDDCIECNACVDACSAGAMKIAN